MQMSKNEFQNLITIALQCMNEINTIMRNSKNKNK